MGGCKWQPAWAVTYPWAQAVPGKPGRVFCKLCLGDFSCVNGKYTLKLHGEGDKHGEREKKAAKEKSAGTAVIQGQIEGALQKAEAAAVKQRRVKDQALKAEAALATLIGTHNMPLGTVDCLAELLPKIFTDSEIVKQMSLHKDKAKYILRFGVAKRMKEKVLVQLRAWPYSLNFDESVKGGKSQMEIVVIFRNTRDNIERSHLLTVEMTVGLTGANISKAVFDSLDQMEVPFKNRLVSNRTDGCSVMLGNKNGCHVNSQAMVRKVNLAVLTIKLL